MTLQKLTLDNIKNLYNKKICCYEYSASYLEELCATFNVAALIECIVDENLRNQGVHKMDSRDVEVCGFDYFENRNLSNTVILITSDYFLEAYEKLASLDVLEHYTNVVYYFVNRETAYELEYRERYKDIPLKKLILFRSGPHAASYVKGMDFADNARALFEYMLQNRYNTKYELVWLVKNPDEFTQYQHIKNVSFLSFDWSVSEKKEERDWYYNALCFAQYLFFTDAYGFARNCRKDQIRVQLWHGCGFKTRVNFVRCEKRYEYTTVISDVYAKIHQEIYGLRKDQVLVTGYAKQDWLFHPEAGWKEKLGIPKAKKYIFWLPTFRLAKEQFQNLNEYELSGQLGLPIIYTYEMMEQMNILLGTLDIVLIIKLHPFQAREKIGKLNMKNIILLDNGQIAEKDIQINQLLGQADALVSDYSSAAVDYMLLDRPIAFTLDDVEEYEQSRGFVFENIREWLPGMELYSFEDLCRFVRDVSEGCDALKEKRQNLLMKMHRYHDGSSCKRIVDKLKIQRE